MNQKQVFTRIAQTTGQQILFLLALGFAGAFVWWWYQAWALLFPAARFLSATGIFVLMISLVYGVVVPLFWSMLLPNSPTGAYLQKQTWAQPGQIAVAGFAIALTYFGVTTMATWLDAVAPDLRASGMYAPTLVAAIAGSIFVPALQFAYQTPGQQMLLIQQAHEIKKLRKLHDGEIAVIEARMVRAAVLAAARWSELLPADKEEVYQTIKGMHMGIASAQRRIARVQGVGADVQRMLGIQEDQEIVEHVDYVKSIIDAPAQMIEHAYEETVDDYSRSQSSIPRGGTQALTPAHVNTRLEPSKPRERMSDKDSHDPPMSDSVARRIASELPRVFTAQNLADLVQQDKRSAQRTIATWMEEGLIMQVQLGRYMLTERSAT